MKRNFASRVFFSALLAAQAAVPLAAQAAAGGGGDSSSGKYIAAGLAIGLACIGGGIAIGQLGAAAMGAIAEDASLSGKALPYLGLAEGVCLWGFLVALLILLV
ncbi:MAG TPA: ATP synthase subunit C [Rectinemataceae bacterium]|nr:ATP synthase subunit C [Rectinemataceae bacterium]